MGFQLIHSAGLRPHSVLEMMLRLSGSPKSAYSRRVNDFNAARTKHEFLLIIIISTSKMKIMGIFTTFSMEILHKSIHGESVFFSKNKISLGSTDGSWSIVECKLQRFFKGTQWLATDWPLWNIEREQRTSADICGLCDSSCSFSYPGFRGWGHLLRRIVKVYVVRLDVHPIFETK